MVPRTKIFLQAGLGDRGPLLAVVESGCTRPAPVIAPLTFLEPTSPSLVLQVLV